MQIEIIRVSGTHEIIECTMEKVWDQIEKAINAKGLDHVNLRDGRMMWVDDLGAVREDMVPVNPEATRLYHSVTLPNTWQIRGDIAITKNSDFGD